MNSPDSVTGRRLAIVALAGAALVLGAWAVVASGPERLPPQQQPVAWWNFDDGAGTMTEDLGGCAGPRVGWRRGAPP